jgi:hypothetical protein
MELHHLTQLILDLISVIDQGARTDPYETWDHVLAGDLFTWLPPQFKSLDVNFLFTFEPSAGSESAGLEILFALSEGREVRGIQHDRNGLAMLIRMMSFLIEDNFQSVRIERKTLQPSDLWSEGEAP